MEEPYVKGVATHDDPESCAEAREGGGEAFDRGTYGPGIEPRNAHPERRRPQDRRKATWTASLSRDAARLRAVVDPAHARKLSAREPGDLRSARRMARWAAPGRP
jgi:hypothetical protein